MAVVLLVRMCSYILSIKLACTRCFSREQWQRNYATAEHRALARPLLYRSSFGLSSMEQDYFDKFAAIMHLTTVHTHTLPYSSAGALFHHCGEMCNS